MKTIIPFQNPRLWETNNNCFWCKTVDDLYNDVLNSTNNDYNQEVLDFLDENYLVNGYRVLSVFEKWGLDDKINAINEYNNLEYNNPIPNILHSRWCEWCGSRKPDIYEE